jgi:hypothetical protein
MINSCENYLFYDDEDGDIDAIKTSQALLGYMKELSTEGLNNDIELGNNEKANIYVVLTTPSSAHWYEKPIAGAQGSYYSHAGLTFDSRMSTLYHVRSEGLVVSKRKDFEKEEIGIDLYKYEVSLKEKTRLQNLIRNMIRIDTKYDFMMIGRLLGKIVLRLKDKEGDKDITPEKILEKKKYICSGWVAGVMAATIKGFRNYLIKARKKWPSFMPQDFVSVKSLVFVKRILFPQNKVLVDFNK